MHPRSLRYKNNVRNNCTALNFPDRLVQHPYKNQFFEQTTNNNENFNFGLVTVRSKDNAKFKLGVPGFSNKDFEFYDLTVILNADEIAEFNQFGISPSFKAMHIVFSEDFIYNQIVAS